MIFYEKEIVKMKKKTIGRLAAASIAAATVVSAMSIPASAVLNPSTGTGTIYKVVTTVPSSTPGVQGTSTTSYYTVNTGLPTGATVTEVNVTSIYPGQKIYIDKSTGKISDSKPSGSNYTEFTVKGSNSGSSGTVGSEAAYVKYKYASDSGYVFLGSNNKYDPNLESLRADGAYLVDRYSPAKSYTFVKSLGGAVYFDTHTGNYSENPNTFTVPISGSSSSHDEYYYDGYWHNGGWYDSDGVWHSGYYDGGWYDSNGVWHDGWYDYYDYTDFDTYDVYKVNGVYYPTLSSAKTAASGTTYRITKVYDYSAPLSNYFSKTTGRYYPTYDDALKASGNSSSNVYTFSYYKDDGYYTGSTGDPYYDLLNSLRKKDNDSSSSSSSSKDTSTPTIGKKKGWTYAANYIKYMGSGTSVTIDMNEEDTIPASVTKAMKGRNVNVKFVLENGVVFTINGKDITNADEIDISTKYNTGNVPKKLVQAAYKKNKAVSAAQISIDNNSFGAEANVTVKFSTKRAGYKAKLYRYNESKGTLTLVDSAKVQDNGKCTFGDVTKGGDFVIVLY